CCESVILRCIVLVLRTPPRPTPFPYTTLFRSAWAHRSWWGPGWQSALPLSNNSPPLDGIGFQRAAGVPSESPWLSWLGPWNTDFFVARTEGDPSQRGSDPLLTGWRLTAYPLPLLEISLTRMAQFGGQGHP